MINNNIPIDIKFDQFMFNSQFLIINSWLRTVNIIDYNNLKFLKYLVFSLSYVQNLTRINYKNKLTQKILR